MYDTNSHRSSAQLADYGLWLIDQSLSPNTKRAYFSRVRQFVSYLAGKSGAAPQYMNAQQRVEAVLKYRDFLREREDISANSINNTLTAIEHYLQFLGSGAVNIDRESGEPGEARILSGEEQQRLLRAARIRHTTRDEALVLLFLHVGLKIGECAALNVGDVGISVGSATLQVPNLRSGKSSRLRTSREVSLDQGTAVGLERWLAERGAAVLDCPEPALFVGREGRRLSIAGIDFVLRSIGWKARLTLSAQILRNTCINNLALATSDLKLLSRIVGHQHAQSTERLVRSVQNSAVRSADIHL